MRITREKLIDLAREEAERRGQTENVLSGYLIGSVVSGDPMIGGSADIDLVLIHQEQPIQNREIVPLSHDIHLDITHHACELYQHPPELRVEPWLGPSMCEPIFLYDPEHFFERAQAGVRGQFFRSDHAYTRSMAFLNRARRMKPVIDSEPGWVTKYMQSALEAANALASLGGFPIAGRRITILLRSRLLELDFEQNWREFEDLLGSSTLRENLIPEWIDLWEEAFDAASQYDPIYGPVRKNYFLKSFLSFIDTGIQQEIFWFLIFTWSSAIEILHAANEDNSYLVHWESALDHLKLSPDHRINRSNQLEDFLDHVEGILDEWE